MMTGFYLWAMLVVGQPRVQIDSVFQLGHDSTGVFVSNPHWLYRVIRGKDTGKWVVRIDEEAMRNNKR